MDMEIDTVNHLVFIGSRPDVIFVPSLVIVVLDVNMEEVMSA